MSRRTASSPSKQRSDIQGLRTVSVGVVIAYHLRPDLLPGGFVGVDVFFVISGFLIVGSLVREVCERGRIDLLDFYARRIRRLVPAATAVLLSTLAATLVLLPQNRWQSIALDIIMSASQIQNWNQAFSSISYESANAFVSPVQHFWSLAVEEQFYLVIPLLLVAAALVARSCGLDIKRTCGSLLALVVTFSLVHSVLFTPSNHDVAYFATTTRIWELGLGGVAALLLPSARPAAGLGALLGWLGLAMILSAALFFSTQLDFPGIVALVPVAGAVFVLVSGAAWNGSADPGRGSFAHPAMFLSLRPVKYLGDISYSLYLWHWPIIVFYVYAAGRTPNIGTSTLLAGGSVVAAALSYHFIEQPLRHGKSRTPVGGRRFRLIPQTRGAYPMGLSMVLVSCLAAAAPWAIVEAKTVALDNQVSSADYPGAMAFDPTQPAHVPYLASVIPDPAVATKDVPLTNKDGCNVYDPLKTAENGCTYGDPRAPRSIVIIGDSHASQYVDPLAELGAMEGWKVRAMVRNGCPFTAAPPASRDTTFRNCSEQNKVSLKKLLANRPDKVVVSGMTPTGYRSALGWGWKNDQELISGYVDLLAPLREANIDVSVILDPPLPSFSVPDCVQRNGRTSSKCAVSDVSGRTQRDPLRMAALKVGGIHVVDLSAYFCRDGSCPSVIGNVLVYRDNHLTNSFARTLRTPLRVALDL